MSTLLEQILAAKDNTLEKLHIPEWNCDVWIGDMGGDARDTYECLISDNRNKEDSSYLIGITVSMVIWCTYKEDGTPLFTENHREMLGKKNYKALRRIYDAALKRNSLTKTETDELEKK